MGISYIQNLCGRVIVFCCFLICFLPCYAQQGSYPYLPLETVEQIADVWQSDGLLRRSADVLDEFRDSEVRSGSDALRMSRAEIERASGLPKSSDRSLMVFLQERSNSPFVPIAMSARGFLALSEARYSQADSLLYTAALRAQHDYSIRRDTQYRTLAQHAYFWDGVALGRMQKFDSAIVRFAACIAADSLGSLAPRALFAMGQMYERLAVTNKASEAYSTIRKKYRTGNIIVAARIREAQIALQQRMPERAVDILGGIDAEILSLSAGDSLLPFPISEAAGQVRILRTNALIMRGGFAEALDSATAYLRESPADRNVPLVRLQSAFCMLNLDSSDDALLHLDKIIDQVTDDASPIRQQALLYRALALRQSGMPEKAVADFTYLAALAGYPYQAQALVEVGQAAYQRGDMEATIRAVDRAEKLSTDAQTTIRSQLLLAAAFLELQKWSDAEAVYERVEQEAAQLPSAYAEMRSRYLAEARLKRGICLAQEGKREAAIRVLTGYVASHPADPQRDEGLFWLAEMMYRSDLLRNAQDVYEELVNRYTASPRREDALYGLAWTFFRKREFDKSIKAFGVLLDAFPKSSYAVDAMVRRGDALYISRSYSQAAEQYRRAARTAPNTEVGQYAGYQAGQALYRAGNLADASAYLRSFASEQPASALADDALYLSGWIAFQQHNDQEAIKEFEYLIDKYPNGDQTANAMFTLADALYNTGDLEGAKARYRSLISKFPMNPLAVEAAKSLQSVLVGEGKTDEAIAVADQMIAYNPQSKAASEFAWEKANIFYSGRNYKSAADELQAFLSKFPDNSRADHALFMLGKTYLSMDDVQQAHNAFTSLERTYPNSEYIALSKMELADFHKERARAKVADSLYAVVMKRYPTDTAEASRAGFERATIARMMLDTLQALNLYRTVADAYPGTEYGDQARYQLALYYRAVRMPDSARTELATLVRTSPSAMIRANALFDMGDLYSRQRMWMEAVEAFEHVRNDYAGYEDWYTLSMIGLGSAYEQLGDVTAARDAYTVVAQLRPNDDYGKTALARLKRLEKQK